jgi:hypothetical protein
MHSADQQVAAKVQEMLEELECGERALAKAREAAHWLFLRLGERGGQVTMLQQHNEALRQEVAKLKKTGEGYRPGNADARQSDAGQTGGGDREDGDDGSDVGWHSW